MMEFWVATEGDAAAVDESCLRALILPLGLDAVVGVGEDEDVDVTGVTTSFPCPTRSERPSKVTRAFSETQERLAELKRARMLSPKRGIEKLVWAAEMRRGMDSPRVTFVYEEPERVVVVQPVALATAQVEPVKPLMQMQEQELVLKVEVPPF